MPQLEAGEIVPGTKYRVVRPLGAGGMGEVYLVEKGPLRGVMKLMSKELAAHQEFRDRFADEVRVLAKLEHPNIVRILDHELEADVPVFVMEVLQGRTLRDVLGTGTRIRPRVAYEITRQLLEALHCAHTHEVTVVHRDIKPENIFLHSPRHGDPVVKLIDFGVVALSDRTHDGSFVGTWSYAAPEQIRGEQATPATDLYAVGLVLFEMLTGFGPFDRYETGPLISAAQLQEVPPPVSKFAPWVPPSIVDLVASALEKDPKHRPIDAYAFSEALYDLESANDGGGPTIRGGADAIVHALNTVRGSDPNLGPLTPAPPKRFGEADTFASQQSNARAPARGRSGSKGILLGTVVAVTFIGLLFVLGAIRMGRREPVKSPAAAAVPPPSPTETVSAATPQTIPAAPTATEPTARPNASATQKPRIVAPPKVKASSAAHAPAPSAPPAHPRDDLMRGL